MKLTKFARATLAAGVTLVALGTATTANAAPATPQNHAVASAASCPDDGRLERNYTCTSLGSGELFHRKYTNNKASTWYKKTEGSSITARVGYSVNGTDHWGGWFSQSSGTTKSGNWSGVSYCSSSVGMLHVKGQQTFQTPPADCTH